MVNLCITVYGLSEEELPTPTCPDGILPLVLPGFCYGSSQDCSNKTVGHIIFLRSTKKDEAISTDELNHSRYRIEVFLPYVQSTRANYLRKEGWEPDDKVDNDHV